MENNCVKLSFLTHTICFARLNFEVSVTIFLSENKRAVLRVCELEPALAAEQQNKKDNNLVDSLSKDVSPHNGVHNLILTSFGRAVEKCLAWRLSSESKSSKRIHDQVDPKHLDRVKWRVRKDHRAGENNKHCNDVNRDLELEELAH